MFSSSNSSPTLAKAAFDDPRADVILQSSDGVYFRVFQTILSLMSPVFVDKFSTARFQRIRKILNWTPGAGLPMRRLIWHCDTAIRLDLPSCSGCGSSSCRVCAQIQGERARSVADALSLGRHQRRSGRGLGPHFQISIRGRLFCDRQSSPESPAFPARVSGSPRS